MSLNMANISEVLKLFYLKELRYQLNDKASALLAQLEKSSESVVGREIRMALRYGRVGGIGNRPDDGVLPTPRARQTRQAAFETKNIFARFRLTDKTIEASKSDVGAFANMLDQEVKDCETDARLDLSRQVIGSGDGVLCTLTAQAAAAVAPATIQTVAVNSTMYLAEGMLVDFRTAATGAPTNAAHVGCEILSVVNDTSFTIADTAVAIDNAAIVCVAGNITSVAGAPVVYELTGVRAVVSTGGTLYGIDRTANPWLNGWVDALNGEISETAIQRNIDRVETKSGSETKFLFCSKGVMRGYQNLQTAMKQHVGTLDLKGGWSALSYSAGGQPIALVSDKYVPAGMLMGLDLNDWKMYQMADWNWMDRDGAVLARVTDRPSYEATLVKYADLGCSRPRGQFIMTGITEH